MNHDIIFNTHSVSPNLSSHPDRNDRSCQRGFHLDETYTIKYEFSGERGPSTSFEFKGYELFDYTSELVKSTTDHDEIDAARDAIQDAAIPLLMAYCSLRAFSNNSSQREKPYVTLDRRIVRWAKACIKGKKNSVTSMRLIVGTYLGLRTYGALAAGQRHLILTDLPAYGDMNVNEKADFDADMLRVELDKSWMHEGAYSHGYFRTFDEFVEASKHGKLISRLDVPECSGAPGSAGE